MNELLDKFIDRPTNQKIIIVGVIIVLLGALFYSFLYGPQADEIARLEGEVGTAENERNVKQKRAANLPRLQKEFAELNARLKEAIAKLPDKKEMAEILKSIAAKARDSGLEVVLFRPRGENFQDFYAEIPVDITVKGDFHDAVGFFDEVGRLHRLININNIGFKNPQVAGDRVILETTSVATAFRFLNEAEQKMVADRKAQAAKNKR